MASKNEELTAAYKGMRKFQWGIRSSVQVAFIAKVVKYDKKNHRADLQPLANMSNGQTSAQYLDVPVAESCYILDEVLDRLKPEFKKVDSSGTSSGFVDKYRKKPFMRAGVPVVAVVLDRDNDNWEGGNKVNIYTPNSSRIHDYNDAVVVAVLGGDAKNG
ncbi:hypothetical protein EFS28_07285 [Lactobacillus acidophilus]|uniref:hypothetical protein n=1 Tax=Lactobacillus acidophilus TaxID=1579 RepID=UPI0021A7114F|nr:hypothetical protein [Lactobacillus acidophilus]MCT3603154.1 hypothetical protein [Lactobacillus acidophilus]MCT3624013.1 hypothetical protein [Lactobacillus acidophilus]